VQRWCETLRWCKHLGSDQNSGRSTLRRAITPLRNFALTPNASHRSAPERRGSYSFHRSACLKTAYARVSNGSVSTANCRQGAEPIVYRYKSPTCVCRKFAGDMSHCPSKLNNAAKALPRAFISAHRSKLINEDMPCHGLFKNSSKLRAKATE
jgi:hypothetical protein